ncbi:hypothetical protein GGI35DRAFT_318217 [Trichoderma velutinum]
MAEMLPFQPGGQAKRPVQGFLFFPLSFFLSSFHSPALCLVTPSRLRCGWSGMPVRASSRWSSTRVPGRDLANEVMAIFFPCRFMSLAWVLDRQYCLKRGI